jgi:hypothetical protein
MIGKSLNGYLRSGRGLLEFNEFSPFKLAEIPVNLKSPLTCSLMGSSLLSPLVEVEGS